MSTHHRPEGYHGPDDLEQFHRHRNQPCPKCRRRHGLRDRCRLREADAGKRPGDAVKSAGGRDATPTARHSSPGKARLKRGAAASPILFWSFRTHIGSFPPR
jgi:hypothetical protein